MKIVATTALERLRELRQEEAAKGESAKGEPDKDRDAKGGGPEGAWPVPSTACPVGMIGTAEASECNQSAADVLALLSGAGAALPHTAIVKALMDLGHDKVAARDAISECQSAGRIEHNLTSGYVLAGGQETQEGTP